MCRTKAPVESGSACAVCVKGALRVQTRGFRVNRSICSSLPSSNRFARLAPLFVRDLFECRISLSRGCLKQWLDTESTCRSPWTCVQEESVGSAGCVHFACAPEADQPHAFCGPHTQVCSLPHALRAFTVLCMYIPYSFPSTVLTMFSTLTASGRMGFHPCRELCSGRMEANTFGWIRHYPLRATHELDPALQLPVHQRQSTKSAVAILVRCRPHLSTTSPARQIWQRRACDDAMLVKRD